MGGSPLIWLASTVPGIILPVIGYLRARNHPVLGERLRKGYVWSIKAYYLLMAFGIFVVFLVKYATLHSGTMEDEIVGALVYSLVGVGLGVFGLSTRPFRRINPGYCDACGYDLTGNLSGRCPECGTIIESPGGGQCRLNELAGNADRLSDSSG